jgi:hypothetical protein
MDEVVDPKSRVAAFLDRFGKERNLTLPPLSDDGVGSIQRGSAVVSIHVLAERACCWCSRRSRPRRRSTSRWRGGC